jgi:hypothetical protein
MYIPFNKSYFQFLGYFLLIFCYLLLSILMSTFCSWTIILLHHRQRGHQVRHKLKMYLLDRHGRRKNDFYFCKSWLIKIKILIVQI